MVVDDVPLAQVPRRCSQNDGGRAGKRFDVSTGLNVS